MKKEFRLIIEKMIEKQCHLLKKSVEETTAISHAIMQKIEAKDIHFDKVIKFSKITSFFRKKRLLVSIEDKLCPEYFLSKYINKILQIKINKTKSKDMISDLINSLENINNIFTIVCFDFKNYYNSLSTEYIYRKCVSTLIDEDDKWIFETYSKQTGYAWAGLTPSDYFAEAISKDFQTQLEILLKEYNAKCIRYVDDYIIISKQQIKKTILINKIDSLHKKIFLEENINSKIKCKTKLYLSENKFYYITQNDLPIRFDYLGYSFNINKNYKFSLELDEFTKKTYKNSLIELISKFNGQNALREIIKLRTRKIVTRKNKIETSSKYVGQFITQFASSLHKHYDKLGSATKQYLKMIIPNCFTELNYPIPNFVVENDLKNGYNPLFNIQKNRAIILRSKTEFKKNKIDKLLKAANPNLDFNKSDYYTLVKALENLLNYR